MVIKNEFKKSFVFQFDDGRLLAYKRELIKKMRIPEYMTSNALWPMAYSTKRF